MTESFGKILKGFIFFKGISQKEFAKNVSLSPTALSQIIRGQSRPRQATLTRIMEFLSLSKEDEQKLLKSYENSSSLVEDASAFSDPIRIYQENRERCYRYLELKTRAIAFKNEVETILKAKGVDYTKDYAYDCVICDFYLPKSNEAIECKFNIMRDTEKAMIMSEIIKKHLKLNKISIVVPMKSEIPEKILKDFAKLDVDVVSLPELTTYMP